MRPLTYFQGSCSALLIGAALAIALPTARADQPFVVPLLISADIPADTAAAQAAARWTKAMSVTPRLELRTLHGFPGKLPEKGVVLVRVRDWSRRMPAWDVLRLPFFYDDVAAVHHALDGRLGARLAQLSRRAGWKLLAVWDAGMTDFSGLQDYSRLLSLTGMQFALWQPDSLQAAELRALDVWTEVIRTNGVQRNAQKCLVDSRSTTPAQMWREHLQRVHLDVTLTRDRYDGFVLAMPNASWSSLSPTQRDNMTRTLRHVTSWERRQAARQQARALVALRKAGMELHHLSAEQRRVFRHRMPPWRSFLKTLDSKTADELVAAARTAAATGRSGGTRKKALTNSQPTTEAAK